MHTTESATELSAVLIEQCGSGANVWLRKNIHTEERELDGDGTQTVWVADETNGYLSWVPTTQEVEEDFDEMWEAFELNGKTDRELVMQALETAERAQAQADFTAILTDTEVG